MNTDWLYRLVEEPSLLNKETLSDLKQLVERYPYFQTARILYLKNLALLDDPGFPSELKKMSVFIPDRTKLFSLLEGARYGLETAKKEEDIQEVKDSFTLIDDFLSVHSVTEEKEIEPAVLFTSTATSDYLHWTVDKNPEETLDDDTVPKLQHQDLIDSFIKEDEQRMPGRGIQLDEDKEKTYSDDYLEEMRHQEEDTPKKTDGESYFTETLARVYIKQRRYDKALQIIKSLSLKYPEKNVYFADQIRFLEKLIINNKK